MTLTHPSHFGLTKLSETSDNIVFEGGLGACKRMAFSHGMEVERYEGALAGIDGNRATYAPVNMEKPAAIWFKGSGLIIRGRDGYCLVMPLSVWKND